MFAGSKTITAVLVEVLDLHAPRSTQQGGGVALLRMTYDRAYWEQLWAKTLREHPDKVAQRR